MEDRYLFKARSDNGEWTVGFYAYIHKKHYIYTGQLIHSGLYDVAERFEVDPFTICQCTGLKDKNGKLIWENDIVKDKNDNFYKAIWQNNYYQYCWVCIKSNIEVFVGGKRDLWSIVENFEIEVIGNIFDNPELLESEVN